MRSYREVIVYFSACLMAVITMFVRTSHAAPLLSLVSERDHIEGSFLVQQSVYADADRIYLGSYQGQLFVLARDRAANFPIIQTIQIGPPLTAVRGNEQYVFISCGDGKVRVYRKEHPMLTHVTDISVVDYRIGELGIFGDDLYVVAGSTLALHPNGESFYVAPLNPGELAFRIKIGTWQIAQTYQLPSVVNTIYSISTQTGQILADISGNSKGNTLFTNGKLLVQMKPGCCGTGAEVFDASTLARAPEPIRVSAANAVAQYNNWFVVGSEGGNVFVLSSNTSPYFFQYGFIFLQQLTGHSNPEDIEIRSLWKDDHDNLIFAGSSWGNDRTRGPELPTFFVLEFNDGIAPRQPGNLRISE